MQTPPPLLMLTAGVQIAMIIIMVFINISGSMMIVIFKMFTLVVVFCTRNPIQAASYSVLNLIMLLLIVDPVAVIVSGNSAFKGAQIWKNILMLLYFIGCAVLTYLGYLLFKFYSNHQAEEEIFQMPQASQQPERPSYVFRNANANPNVSGLGANRQSNRSQPQQGFSAFSGQGYRIQ